MDKNLKSHISDNDKYSKGFKPSKTAQNSLNFITPEDEAELLTIESTDYVCDTIRAINILIKNNDVIPRDQLISNLITKALPELNVKDLSIYY